MQAHTRLQHDLRRVVIVVVLVITYKNRCFEVVEGNYSQSVSWNFTSGPQQRAEMKLGYPRVCSRPSDNPGFICIRGPEPLIFSLFQSLSCSLLVSLFLDNATGERNWRRAPCNHDDARG